MDHGAGDVTDLATIGRALISVSNKTGLVEFARKLSAQGVVLLSTGGTAAALKAAGLKVTDVSEHTGFPEMMDGRVKTLHPKVHGGLLAVRGNASHEAAAKAHDIPPIDLLVVNLYPFEATVAKGADYDTCVENIDIGGPAMIRAAAKNHASVTVVVDAADYDRVLDEMSRHGGATTARLRRELAQKAYARTAAYDGAISNWLGAVVDSPDGRATGFPRTFSMQLSKALPMRYGENPHQQAAFYVARDAEPGSIASARQLQGKELSYNNIADTDAALECVKEFAERPACVIVKHANPCGVAEADSLLAAYDRAYLTDTEFGVRRHYRVQPRARRCHRECDRRAPVRRGDHRPVDRKGGRGGRREEEERPPARLRQLARQGRSSPRLEKGQRWHAGAGRRSRALRQLEGRHQSAADCG